MFPEYIQGYLYVAVAGAIAVAFVLVSFGLVKVLAPSAPEEEKGLTYECGVDPQGPAWIPFHIQYYVFALLFLIFDIETVFVFPWALIFRKLGWFGWLEMLVFVLILLFGLLYAWRRKVLRWI